MKKENINAVKVGNVVNVSISGKLHKKNCGSPAEADELFRLVLDAKANPTEDAVNGIRAYLNEKLRVAYLMGLENDPETGQVFLAGFNTPIPTQLVDVLKEYHEEEYPIDALINFWKLLMLNPDVTVRENLFGFIGKHDFSVTDKGYMVVYKAVYEKDDANTELAQRITELAEHVKADWKCSLKKYTVYRTISDGGIHITKAKTAKNWDAEKKGIEIVGNLKDLSENLDALKSDDVVYTDMHTRKMRIELGVPVHMDRKECDSDPKRDCSYGLHVGATSYVEGFAGNGEVLVCLVNPAHVVAVPNYDHSKMRVSEYFPMSVAKYENRKIDIIEEKYFENDYVEYEEMSIEELVAKVQANEKPIETAKNAKEDSRPMSELQKILESRLVDLQ